MIRKTAQIFLSLAVSLLAASCASVKPMMQSLTLPRSLPSANAQEYFTGLYQRINLSREQLPVLQAAGRAAAWRATSGGLVWVGGSQGDFAAEAINRAGGLACARLLDISKVFKKDVVLYGARGSLSTSDLASIAKCKNAGAYVIAFAAKLGTPRTPDGPDLLIDSGDTPGLAAGYGICPLDTVTNLINLWVWTGEFTAACTQLGRTPVLFSSDNVSSPRDARYVGRSFHDDMNLDPIPPLVLGRAYLDRIEGILKRISRDELPDFAQAGRWLDAAGPARCGGQFMAHIYPDHFHDPRTPHPLSAMAGPDDPPPAKAVLLHISAQPPPQGLIDAARDGNIHLFQCAVLRGKGGTSENIIYVNPHWPASDGCVTLPGYDVPILASSGVVQATIYWSIVAEAYRAAQ